MREIACQFGEQVQIAGIVTEPAGDDRNAACVLIGAGLVPKYGPYRLYALLSRALSQSGFLALRFDLGGIGDSRQAYAGLMLKERTALEVRAALDYLDEHYPLDSVIVGGLCSGAEDAFRHAETDPRVTGVLMIDPFCYRTSGWRSRNLLHRATKLVMRATGAYAPHPSASQPVVTYKYMEYVESRRILEALIARGVKMHFVYTGGSRHFFNHHGQFQKMFRDVDFRGLVTVDHFPEMQHIQALEQHRQKLIGAVVHRMKVNWP